MGDIAVWSVRLGDFAADIYLDCLWVLSRGKFRKLLRLAAKDPDANGAELEALKTYLLAAAEAAKAEWENTVAHAKQEWLAFCKNHGYGELDPKHLPHMTQYARQIFLSKNSELATAITGAKKKYDGYVEKINILEKEFKNYE